MLLPTLHDALPSLDSRAAELLDRIGPVQGDVLVNLVRAAAVKPADVLPVGLTLLSALGSPVVRGAVDDLLGHDAWSPPREWGTILVTFPAQDRPWVLPARSWHADYGWDLDPEPLFGVKVFAFFTEVRPRGGGTLVITGSHRVVARFAGSLPPQQPFEGHLLGRYLRRDDWFRALSRPGDDDPGRAARFMDRDHHAGGIAVWVAELTGQPGDVVLTHPWVLHSWSYNTGSYPRMMLTKNLYRRGLRPPEAEDAIGTA